MAKLTDEQLKLNFSLAFAKLSKKTKRAEWKKFVTPDKVWRWIEVCLVAKIIK